MESLGVTLPSSTIGFIVAGAVKKIIKRKSAQGSFLKVKRDGGPWARERIEEDDNLIAIPLPPVLKSVSVLYLFLKRFSVLTACNSLL
jgi:hypothetical protein